jgi:hypothetical protein
MVSGDLSRHAADMTAQIIDLAACRARSDQAVARVAAAPVRHVPAAFLAALRCVDEMGEGAPAPVLRLAR